MSICVSGGVGSPFTPAGVLATMSPFSSSGRVIAISTPTRPPTELPNTTQGESSSASINAIVSRANC